MLWCLARYTFYCFKFADICSLQTAVAINIVTNLEMAQKPGIPKGTRDFSSKEVARRQYIMQIIRTQFERFGFQPIETPSFENSETLMGKYGEEGDRLIFKILNSGDYLSKVDEKLLNERDSQKLTSQISEKALRYDLTVPFARYVVQHQNEIDFPFKRYQMQPVWRADRPQKGRFREFYQCDADVVGSESLWQEVELIQLYDAVFTDLGLQGVQIKLNNRKILSGIAEVMGASDKLVDFTVALDKLDKIGIDGVQKEMLEKGITQESIDTLQPLFTLTGSLEEKANQLAVILATSEEGKKGIEELLFIAKQLKQLELKTAKVDFDVTLARGLNYYTGAILEVGAPEGVSMGSIGGGGRYDDLTGIFGLKNISGVGISFGLDRIYLVMESLELFPEKVSSTSKVVFVNYGDQESLYAMQAISKLRDAGISAELYPDAVKVGKQFSYIDKRQIPFAVAAGESEMANNQYGLKTMASGNQEMFSLSELIAFLK